MARSLYVVAMEPNTGKSVVSLALMEMLARRVDRVGFFRPVVVDRSADDPFVELFRRRYPLAGGDAPMVGVSYADVHELAAAGRVDEIVGRVVERFRALERQCDAVLCVGSDYTDVGSSTEFALNLRLADNLGAPVLAVVGGRRRSAADVVTAVHAARDALAAAGNPVVAIVANMVEPGAVDDVRAALTRDAVPDAGSAGAIARPASQETPPVFVVPFDPVLVEPTVGQIADAVHARLITGDPAELDRDVRGVVVGAATLPSVLEHLVDGALVITPGDRDDVVLGVLAAAGSPSAPKISGLLLSAGLLPDPRVRRVLEGLAPHTPVLATEPDTFHTAQAVAAVHGSLSAGSERKLTAALGAVETNLDLEVLERRLDVTRSTRVTPLMFEYDLIERARADQRRIVLPEGTDDRILRATEIIGRRGIAAVTLLGNEDAVRARAAQLDLDLGDAVVLDPMAPGTRPLRDLFSEVYAAARAHKGMTLAQARDVVVDVSYFGTLMVQQNLADGMVSGAAHTTAHTIRPSFEIIKTVPGTKTVSSVFLMCLADRVLVYGDCAVIPAPDAEQLADIALSSAGTAERFGIEPRVAMLSYSTGESGSGADVEKVRAATALVRERDPDLLVEGPIQYDAAVDATVAAAKLPGSRVAGSATVFVFPDLNTGNNTYKAVQRSAGAVAIGPILQGLRRPVNDLSRGCLVADIVNTVAITAIQAQAADGDSPDTGAPTPAAPADGPR